MKLCEHCQNLFSDKCKDCLRLDGVGRWTNYHFEGKPGIGIQSATALPDQSIPTELDFSHSNKTQN